MVYGLKNFYPPDPTRRNKLTEPPSRSSPPPSSPSILSLSLSLYSLSPPLVYGLFSPLELLIFPWVGISSLIFPIQRVHRGPTVEGNQLDTELVDRSSSHSQRLATTVLSNARSAHLVSSLLSPCNRASVTVLVLILSLPFFAFFSLFFFLVSPSDI